MAGAGPSMPGARVMELSAFAQACFVAAERLERLEDPEWKRWHENGIWALEQVEQEYDRQARNAERMAEAHNERVRRNAAPGEDVVHLVVHRPPGLKWLKPRAQLQFPTPAETGRGPAVPADAAEKMTEYLAQVDGDAF